VPVPRLESWHGTRPYAFGGRVWEPQPWPTLLLSLLFAVEGATGAKYDSCFANLYRDGQDSIAWHSDDDDWIREPIASVTFGAARRFAMRHKATRVKQAWLLGDGDLFVMRPGTQAAWEHSVPKTDEKVGQRLNLTFRGTK
jgi:alkylated DNA repair dioxygenase AlkB